MLREGEYPSELSATADALNLLENPSFLGWTPHGASWGEHVPEAAGSVCLAGEGDRSRETGRRMEG